MDALAAQAAEQAIRDFLIGIKSDVGIADFVEVVGADLLASRVLNAAEFGSPPNSLQVAKLTRRMRGSGVQGSDLENSADCACIAYYLWTKIQLQLYDLENSTTLRMS